LLKKPASAGFFCIWNKTNKTQLTALNDCDKLFQEKEPGAEHERPQLVTIVGCSWEGSSITIGWHVI
jgi:hypothetical protein